MAGPTTETLSEDAKELSRELSILRSDLAREIPNLRLELSEEIADFRIEFAGFQSRVTTQLAIIKWVGVFFSTMFLAFFCGTVGFAWNASVLYMEVKEQGRRIEKIDSGSTSILLKLDRIEERLNRIETRLNSSKETSPEPNSSSRKNALPSR